MIGTWSVYDTFADTLAEGIQDVPAYTRAIYEMAKRHGGVYAEYVAPDGTCGPVYYVGPRGGVYRLPANKQPIGTGYWVPYLGA